MAELHTLPPGTIKEINHTVRGMENKHLVAATPGQAIAWLQDVGGLISTFLPQFLQVFKAVAALTSTEPTIAEFFAMGNSIFNGTPLPAPAPAEAATG